MKLKGTLLEREFREYAKEKAGDLQEMTRKLNTVFRPERDRIFDALKGISNMNSSHFLHAYREKLRTTILKEKFDDYISNRKRERETVTIQTPRFILRMMRFLENNEWRVWPNLHVPKIEYVPRPVTSKFRFSFNRFENNDVFLFSLYRKSKKVHLSYSIRRIYTQSCTISKTCRTFELMNSDLSKHTFDLPFPHKLDFSWVVDFDFIFQRVEITQKILSDSPAVISSAFLTLTLLFILWLPMKTVIKSFASIEGLYFLQVLQPVDERK